MRVRAHEAIAGVSIAGTALENDAAVSFRASGTRTIVSNLLTRAKGK